MKQKIIKAGNSLAVTIPSQFVKKLGLKSGHQVTVMPYFEKNQITYTFTNSSQLPLMLGAKDNQ